VAVAPPHLRQELLDVATELAKRHWENIEWRGP
jgi:hypothetical protein